ncbi:MAG: DUF89 family protein [Nanoarchaeota archaeon]|nr:DUF89 family protein [Nanoarchaeota archaeon]
MRTYLECVPCFLTQAIKAARLSGKDEKVTKNLLRDMMELFSSSELDKKPPEYARMVYNRFTMLTKEKDPYKEIKRKDNMKALELLPEVNERIIKADDKLLAAVKIAIAGNIMDYAANPDYNITKTLNHVLNTAFAIDDLGKFKVDINKANSIVYLADNAGEIVFDRLLLEKIREINSCKIHFYVKGEPILNDATLADAKLASIDKINNIEIKHISTGFPNTGARKESGEFEQFLKAQSMVISKGQGNYESLSESDANIYFLLIAKCSILARDLGVKKGDIIIKRNGGDAK